MGQSRILKVITDNGFGFSFVSFLFYANDSALGMWATLASLLLIAAVKLQADSTAYSWVKDPRTPLRISGLGLLLIAFGLAAQLLVGTAQASSSSIATIENMTLLDTAPFFSALFFGTANMLLASQLADINDKPLPFTRNPETFLFLGYICVGFVSGVTSLYAMPFVALAFAITMYNYKNGKPVYNLHPVLIYALAELCFGAVALHEGKMVLLLADILCAICLLRIDLELTPGGVKYYTRAFIRK